MEKNMEHELEKSYVGLIVGLCRTVTVVGPQVIANAFIQAATLPSFHAAMGLSLCKRTRALPVLGP